jgi:hypothetical protein
MSNAKNASMGLSLAPDITITSWREPVRRLRRSERVPVQVADAEVNTPEVVAALLRAVEQRAVRASVLDLRRMMSDVRSMAAMLHGAEREYACLLLRKLDRLVGDQLAEDLAASSPRAVSPPDLH